MWHHIFALENFPSRIFLQESPPPPKKKKKCGAKLVTVANQPVARPPPISYAYSQANSFFLNQWNILTVTDLVEVVKSGTLSRKISISERLGSDIHLYHISLYIISCIICHYISFILYLTYIILILHY